MVPGDQIIAYLPALLLGISSAAWLTVHNRAVITVILLVLGIAITARGLTGLG